jgi:Co/Zn/Cd efflux system component
MEFDPEGEPPVVDLPGGLCHVRPMSARCCGHDHQSPPASVPDGLYRRVLWIAFGVNAGMFLVEIAAGLAAGSVSLQADAIDFLGDAGNYLVSLAVLGLALRWRAGAALLKGATMGGFSLWVVANAVLHAVDGTLPGADVMGAVGLLALAANVGVAIMLYRHRGGDANRRSVWICSRNDALVNVAVLLAALGVFGTGAGWPDIVVALVIAGLAGSGAFQVVRQALGELRAGGGLAAAE